LNLKPWTFHREPRGGRKKKAFRLLKRAIEEGSSLVHALILKGHTWRSGNDFWQKRADIKNWMASVLRIRALAKSWLRINLLISHLYLQFRPVVF
jgi:hypothetical protein